MEGFAVVARIEVRWRDLDAMGHVNNAVYFTFFEIARTRYYAEVFGAVRIEDINFILASVRCDFVAEAGMGEVLEVGIRVPSVGRTSFDFEYEVRGADDGRVVARGSSTQVLYDYRARKKIPITDAWLDRVAAVQGSRPGPRA